MPWKPLGPCRVNGCPGRAEAEGYCAAHKPAFTSEKRWGNSLPFYHTARWQRIREMVLARSPLCVQCEQVGLVTIANTVDHIIPIRLGGNALDANNMQTLCQSCHDKKRRKEKDE